jgi:hypothetical protein
MKFEFNFLCEQILNSLLCEGLDASFLRKKNAEASVYKKSLKTPEAKQKLKSLSKELIIHILNANYKNILSKYFPNLVPISNKMSDSDFKVKLDAELASSTMSAETYNSLLNDIDKIIYELSSRNNNELTYLLYLRTSYLLGYRYQ